MVNSMAQKLSAMPQLLAQLELLQLSHQPKISFLLMEAPWEHNCSSLMKVPTS